MSHTPHELAEDFPGKAALIHMLKTHDGDFRFLAARYRKLNRAIHRAETNVEPTDRFHQEAMRKERVRLRDRIAARIAAAETLHRV